MARKKDIAIKNPIFDRRFKLLPCQIEMIPTWYKQGESINELAKRLKVSYSTIYFITKPYQAERNKELGIKRGGSSIYYDKNKHTESVTKHRKYKTQLFPNKMKIKKSLLKSITKDIQRIERAISLSNAKVELKTTLQYSSNDDIDLYMVELSKQFNVYNYQIEIAKNSFITINFD